MSRNAWTRIKKSSVPVVWASFGIFSVRSNAFLSRLVAMDETWLCHYEPETKQQSMEWRHSGSPRPKKFRVQKSLENSRIDFFGIQTASSPLIIFQRVKLSTWSINYLCWFNWRAFWRKNAAGRSPRRSCSCTTMLRLTGHLQPRRNWPTWASNFSITHPIPRIWPQRTTTCSLDWKNNWKGAIFRPTRRSLLPRRPGCADNLLKFFWVACRSQSNRLRSVLSFVGSMLDKSRVWSL